jgi:CRP/FNR family transcriptional regulator, anaerobic regulatory protein
MPAMSTRTRPVVPLQPVVTSPPFNPQAVVCMACGVRRHALFGVLDDEALENIHYHIADITLAPGERLYSAHEQGSAAFTVREGVVRLERSSERGERRILRLVGASGMAGMEAMLGQAYAADAVACTPVRACRLPRVLVDELARERPELLRDLMKRWQGALDEADEWLTEMTAGSARWRMLRLLLKLSEYGTAQGTPGSDERIWLPSRQEMAAMLAMTVETSSRLVSALRREGLIEAVDAHHVRLDMQALLGALKLEAAEGA